MKGNAVIGTSPYKASLTREQFLFYEMRATAKLCLEYDDEDTIVKMIIDENLFQYPTEKSIKRMAMFCLKRIRGLKDRDLIEALANKPVSIAKQVCLYAMIKESRLVYDFMLTVIAEKYRIQDLNFSKLDLNVFFMRLQEQDEVVATWSDSTITKLKQVLVKTLVENEYLDNTKSEKLNPVLLSSTLENAIRSNNDEQILPAFNCFS